MAVDTAQLTAIYDTLSTSAKGTLDEQWDTNRLRGADYANVVAQTMVALIQTSAQLLLENERNTQDAPIKTAQAAMIEQQKLTEVEKTTLTARQTTAYDDNLRVEEAKALKDVNFGYAVGGNTVPEALMAMLKDSIEKLEPNSTLSQT